MLILDMSQYRINETQRSNILTGLVREFHLERLTRHTEHLLIMTMLPKRSLMVSIPLAHFLILRKAMRCMTTGAVTHFIQRNLIMKMVMHHKHRTQSKIYDYWGKEEYTGNYVMADVNIGSKLNIISGVRTEKNVTTYKAFTGLEGTLPHFSAACR